MTPQIATFTKKEKMTTLQKRLQEAVREKGVTITRARADLQRLTGLSRATMTHWFFGKAKEPRHEATAMTADYFGVHPLWLARGIGPKRGKQQGVKNVPISKLQYAAEFEKLVKLAEQMDEKTFKFWVLSGQMLIALTAPPKKLSRVQKRSNGAKQAKQKASRRK